MIQSKDFPFDKTAELQSFLSGLLVNHFQFAVCTHPQGASQPVGWIVSYCRRDELDRAATA